jgi:hypothetical protein
MPDNDDRTGRNHETLPTLVETDGGAINFVVSYSTRRDCDTFDARSMFANSDQLAPALGLHLYFVAPEFGVRLRSVSARIQPNLRGAFQNHIRHSFSENVGDSQHVFWQVGAVTRRPQFSEIYPTQDSDNVPELSDAI